MTESLAQIYERHRVTGPDVGMGDKGGTHSYIGEYERLLSPFRQKSDLVFMEIGLAQGLSIAMWREYFSLPTQTVIGVDISLTFDVKPHADQGTFLLKCDATKPKFIERANAFAPLDVVIDDASHMANDQETTFRLLKPLMAKGGLYVIEDILALEQERERFKQLHSSCEILDLRSKKGRFDDVLIVYHF